MPAGRVAASVPENLSLFLDQPTKSEDSAKKMSKDSILSLYSSATPQTNMTAHGKMSLRVSIKLFNEYFHQSKYIHKS